MTIESILPYLLPPLLGAIIGYVTNYVAIRMLFRPLRPWKVFGLRIPMTPGIIPAKRGELAVRMGEMVGSHLLTPNDVVKTLEQQSFQRELKMAVSEKLGLFLDRDLGSLSSLVPIQFQERFCELVDIAGDKLSVIIANYLQSAEFEKSLHRFILEKTDAFLALDLEKCLNPQQYDSLHKHVDGLLSDYLSSPELAESVGNFVDEKTGRMLRSSRPLRSLLPEDLVTILLAQLEKEVPPMLEKFSGMLYDPDFRQRLTGSIRQGIEKFLDSLGGLAGLMSGFIDLDKIYAKIPDTLDQISEEVALWLKEEKTRSEIAGMIRERLEGFLEKPLADYVEKLPYEKVDGMRQFLRDRVVDAVQSRRTTEALLGLGERGVQGIKNRSFGSLLDAVLPDKGRDSALALLEGKILATARSESFSASISDVVGRQMRVMLCEKSLGRLSSRLPADVNEELEELLYQQLVEVLKKEIPVLVDALNIRQMVEDKVNALDLLEVEGLLLGIMQEQFKYINLFGGLLGFLIGLINLLVLQLRPF
jgi:uncharacterized membrane protein YheB (UPF0754 family)